MKSAVVLYKPSYLFWSLIAVGIVFMGLRHTFLSSQKKVLDHYGSVPEFQLLNQEGKTVTLKDLRGSIWVAAFVFTRCRGPCPIITTHMAKLSNILREGSRAKLVSITVDPDYDTPKVLSRYAGNFHADPKRWIFLTGPREKVEALVVSGMYQAVVRGSQSGPIHSTQLVLVDPHGQIRAIHDSTNPQVITQIVRDIYRLEQEFAVN
jgi:protein SCO1